MPNRSSSHLDICGYALKAERDKVPDSTGALCWRINVTDPSGIDVEDADTKARWLGEIQAQEHGVKLAREHGRAAGVEIPEVSEADWSTIDA